jgi:hypothetical protein
MHVLFGICVTSATILVFCKSTISDLPGLVEIPVPDSLICLQLKIVCRGNNFPFEMLSFSFSSQKGKQP